MMIRDAIKVRLSPSKKFCFICFNKIPFKMMKHAFLTAIWHLGHSQGDNLTNQTLITAFQQISTQRSLEAVIFISH